MNNFQMIILGAFVVFIIIGVVVFAGFGKDGSVFGGDTTGNVVMWGTVSDDEITGLLDELRTEKSIYEGLSYVQIDENIFSQQLSEAMASGKGPDIFLLPQDLILKHTSKVLPISYERITVRDFKDKYIEGSELYLGKNGVLALPFIVDPMVMYWNRDIFSKNGLAKTPTNWDEFFNLSNQVTQKDDNLNILLSFVSFGEYTNVDHAKDIVSNLIMQAGGSIVKERNGKLMTTLAETVGNINPADQSVDFYVQFSNPVKSVYSWNKAMENSQRAFLSGKLAVYFGYASELSELREKNPNLNFDVAMMPQVTDGFVTTSGKMMGLALSKGSKNPSGAFEIMNGLASEDVLAIFSNITNLPPVARNLLVKADQDPYKDVFRRSALISHSWLDPEPEETNLIFKEMIDSVVSGRREVANSVLRASSEITPLLEVYEEE